MVSTAAKATIHHKKNAGSNSDATYWCRKPTYLEVFQIGVYAMITIRIRIVMPTTMLTSRLKVLVAKNNASKRLRE